MYSVKEGNYGGEIIEWNEFNGFKMLSRKGFHINGEVIKIINVVDKTLAHPVVYKKVMGKYSDLVPVLTEMLISDDDSGDSFREALNHIEKFRLEIKNKYREFLKKKEQNANSLTVFLNNSPIGFIGLKIIDMEAEVSYIFDYDYVNNGYCSEVLNKLVDISFNDLMLDKLFAYSKEENISSRKVLEKNGFKESGTKEDFIYYELRKEV